ncbi:MAG TPA: alpha-2-macroglobulin family protein, partial [Lamprocystis sp. (in: g-proteobacteria)]|nr:alpha-2-macroglobulin family protein [Lamprocystis sp. (in: g-proteobacteria)]
MMLGPGDGSEPVGVVRTRFDTLLLWRGRVGLDARGEASIEVPLNDSLSRFRIVAVATAGAGHFGTGQARIRTAQDLMLFSGVPPLVRSGDRIEAVFTARNAASRPLELAASARVGSETGDLPALPQRHLHLAAGESREIAWTIEVPDAGGTLTWEAGLQEVGGPAQDRLRVEQQVQPVLSVRTYQATLGSLDQPIALEVARPADAVPGQGG